MASLTSCKTELRSIISELKLIEYDVRNNFSGIGQDKCADCINRVISKYEYLLWQLETVDLNAIAQAIQQE